METREVLKSYFQSAPVNIRLTIKQLIDSPETISTMADKHGVSVDLVDTLRSEIFLVLLGIEPLSSLRANLVEELDITYDQALKIAFDTNAQIFGPVMGDLKNIQSKIEHEGDATGETTPASKPEPTSPFIPNPSKSGITKMGPETDPVHILMDHKEMERVDGPHLHSQNVMPSVSESKGSIVDQKLSRIFKSSPAPTSTPATPKPLTKGYVKDPYREPLE